MNYVFCVAFCMKNLFHTLHFPNNGLLKLIFWLFCWQLPRIQFCVGLKPFPPPPPLPPNPLLKLTFWLFCWQLPPRQFWVGENLFPPPLPPPNPNPNPLFLPPNPNRWGADMARLIIMSTRAIVTLILVTLDVLVWRRILMNWLLFEKILWGKLSTTTGGRQKLNPFIGSTYQPKSLGEDWAGIKLYRAINLGI